MNVPTLGDRACGVLVHLTSLAGPHGCGDLGDSARAMIEFLASSDQRWWQMLPVGPLGYGNSPYSAQSAFAGSDLLIALAPLVSAGWLDARALDAAETLPRGRIDYQATARFRETCLRAAFATFYARNHRDPQWEACVAFAGDARAWLDGFALFRALKRVHGGVAWTDWPAPLRDRDRAALGAAVRDLRDEIAFEKFVQWVFHEQWRSFRAACASRGLGLIGDVPIFVAHDSADVWANRELFHLADDGRPTLVAGVPPDYFSRTGQRWGNPLYRWTHAKKTGFRWWIDRLKTTLDRFDAVRLDHFIGFQRYWEIPASEPTAVKGRWMKGPGAPFFEAVREAVGALPLIAEDLGAVTPRVLALRDRFHLPGIKVLQFAFGTDASAPSFLPHNYTRRAVVYTGTHDNDTTRGWFEDPGGASGTRSPEQTEKERRTAMHYLGVENGREIHWSMIRAAYASVATTAIVPLQDVLGLGTEARMNHPGTASGNWEWRVAEGALTRDVGARLADLARTYDRGRALASGDREANR